MTTTTTTTKTETETANHYYSVKCGAEYPTYLGEHSEEPQVRGAWVFTRDEYEAWRDEQLAEMEPERREEREVDYAWDDELDSMAHDCEVL